MDYKEGKKLADEAWDLALKLFNTEKLSKDEESQMMTAAQACIFIWSRVGTSLQIARSHALASKIFCRMSEAKLALMHAQLCDFHTKKAGDRRDFDEAYAVEALARAQALKGDLESALRLRMQAKELGMKIRDAEERSAFENQLSSPPWFGLKDI